MWYVNLSSVAVFFFYSTRVTRANLQHCVFHHANSTLSNLGRVAKTRPKSSSPRKDRRRGAIFECTSSCFTVLPSHLFFFFSHKTDKVLKNLQWLNRTCLLFVSQIYYGRRPASTAGAVTSLLDPLSHLLIPFHST